MAARENIITSFGGGEELDIIFNAIATITGGGVDSIFFNMLYLAAMVAGFWCIVLIIISNNTSHGVKWFIWYLIATQFLFLPKTTIFIYDPINRTERTVANVPISLAIVAGTFSELGRIITEEMEMLLTDVEDLSYHKTGMVFGSKLMSQMGTARIVDPNFKRNIDKFISECIVYDAMIGHKYTIKELKNSDNIWELVTTNASQIAGFPYRDLTTNHAEIITCKEGAAKLQTQWQEQIGLVALTFQKKNIINEAIGYSLKRMGGLPIKDDKSNSNFKATVLTTIGNTFDHFVGIGNDATSILKQEMMINALIDSSHNRVAELGGASNYASTKAILQQRSTYNIVGDIAAKTLPVMKVVFESLIYGSFIFIVLLALMPGGHKHLITYFGSLIWVQLWAPLYAILNMIMTNAAKVESMKLVGGSGLTLMNSAGLINLNADKLALAGYLSMSIPFISYAIIKGGASAFVNLASHLGSGYQSASASVANEVTSGNISMGNVSQGVHSYNNMSAFQHNTSPSFRAGQFETSQDDGSIKTVNADGSVVYRAGSGLTASQFQTDVRLNEGISSQLQKNIADEKSFMESKSKELSNAETTAIRQTTDFLERFSKGSSNGESYDISESSSSAKSIQNSMDFSKQLQDKFELNERQSFALAAAVSASLGIGNGKKGGLINIAANLGGDAKYSSDASRTQILDEAISLAKRTGFSENMDSISRAAKDIKYSANQSEEASLAKSMSESTDTTHALRKSVSGSEQNIARYSDALSYVTTQGASINVDANQKLLNYVANQQVNRGPNHEPTKIGYDQAKRIINSGDSTAKSYIDSFVRNEVSGIASKFGNEAMNSSENIDLAYGQYAMSLYTNSISRNAEELAKNKGIGASVTGAEIINIVNQELTDNSNKISEQRNISNTNFDNEQIRIRKTQNENLVVKSAKNLLGIKNENNDDKN